jgi:PPE-repeat protein
VVAVDFGALPPEINSGLMYAGAGSGSLVGAAAAWEGLASELGSAASSYRAVVSDLTGGPWVGPSSVAMAAAAAPYAAWMSSTAAAAEQTASQVGSAIAAYEAAFAATVAPPVIAANRALLAALVATNILGQNTPAIAATEALYAEMWAQDAGAMYGYAGASAAATTVTPFNPPPQTTNPAGTSTQAAAAAQAAASPAGAAQNALSQVPAALQSLASGHVLDGVTSTIVTGVNSPGNQAILGVTDAIGTDSGPPTVPSLSSATLLNSIGPLFAFGFGGGPAAAAPAAAAAAAAPAPAAVAAAPAAGLAGSYGSGMGGAGVSAGLGQAATVGGLSVPQSWATESPAIRLAATALPAAGLDGLPQAGTAGLGFGGMPMMGGVVNASRNGAAGPRPESRLKMIPQLGTAPGGHEGIPDRGITPTRRAVDAVDALSERERHELQTLREEIADLAMERDAVDRLISEAMRR